jgi:hypothetical protein
MHNYKENNDFLPEWADRRLHSFLEYWNEVRGGRRFPNRSDIEPLDFHQEWPLVFLVEGTRVEDLTIRLAGTAYWEIYGFELTGRKLVDVVPRNHTRDVLDDFDKCLREGRPVFAANQMRWRPRHSRLNYHRLILPLGDSQGRVSHVLGLAMFFDLSGRALFV